MRLIQRLKNKVVATFIVITSALGIQYVRPPVLEQGPPPVDIKIEKQSEYPESTSSNKNNITIKFINATKQQVDEIIIPGDIFANKILQSKCFEDYILKTKFTETNDLTNEQILDIFKNKNISAGVVFFYGSFAQNYIYKTVGLENGDGNIYVNSFYVDNPDDFGSLEMHEGSHILGFHHYNVFDTSIPYKMNYFYSECKGKQ